MTKFPELSKKAILGLLAIGSLIPMGCSSTHQTAGSGGGNGAGAAAAPGTLIPTRDAVVARIELGLTTTGGTQTATHTAGNFQTALTQLSPNLPNSANPLKGTGLDQIPLLVLAACSDVKPTAYNVNTSSSVSSQTTALVAAGVEMLDQNLGGMASGGPLSAQVSQVFSTLVAQDLANGDTTATTFLSVCLAANAYGVGMRGF